MSEIQTKILNCPRCSTEMKKTKISKGFVHTCNQCQGLMLGTGLLNQVIESRVTGRIHTSSQPDPSMTCSYCKKQMSSGTFDESDPIITASACKNCYVTFMDIFEFELLKNQYSKKDNSAKNFKTGFSITSQLPSPTSHLRSNRKSLISSNSDIFFDLTDLVLDIFSDIDFD